MEMYHRESEDSMRCFGRSRSEVERPELAEEQLVDVGEVGFDPDGVDPGRDHRIGARAIELAGRIAAVTGVQIGKSLVGPFPEVALLILAADDQVGTGSQGWAETPA